MLDLKGICQQKKSAELLEESLKNIVITELV